MRGGASVPAPLPRRGMMIQPEQYCPVCGAQEGYCGLLSLHERLTRTDGRAPREFPYRARGEVYEELGNGRRRLIITTGQPIPLIEALRQGVVKLEDLAPSTRLLFTEHWKRELANRRLRGLEPPPPPSPSDDAGEPALKPRRGRPPGSKNKMLKEPEQDKMLRPEESEQKA